MKMNGMEKAAARLSRDGRSASLDRQGADRDADIEPNRVVHIADITARDRQRLLGCPRGADADEIGAGNEPVGRIILHPARSRQVDAAPGMRAAAAPSGSRRVVVEV